jgi:hypothetical protein
MYDETRNNTDALLFELNNLHKNLQFTTEKGNKTK